MLDVFVAKLAAVLAHGESDAVAARLVIGAGVLGIESLHRTPTFYTDRHGTIGLAVHILLSNLGVRVWSVRSLYYC
jgi:hypothetical protein